MLMAIVAVVCGLVVLVKSADIFVGNAAETARYFNVPSVIVGMVIIGFGTSAPEMVVSSIASIQGNPGIALGNAYGSNIANIGLILGLTAVIAPITVQKSVARKEIPILLAVTILAALQASDGVLSRLDAVVLMTFFAVFIGYNIISAMKSKQNDEKPFAKEGFSVGASILKVIIGITLLIISSRALVWGAVIIAQKFGVSDIVIGLTVVAVGTSLPELASSISAIKNNEHDMALGNVIGSNIFNTLAVVGIAGLIKPFEFPQEIFTRDVAVMGLMVVILICVSFSIKGRNRIINRAEGAFLLISYMAYTIYLIKTSIG